ncbi:MAG: uroporphyrinogen-III C-methyltransferase [Granulosicoccaceae bacterium]|jgi:uroporphyrin-3 C-methyltransferase
MSDENKANLPEHDDTETTAEETLAEEEQALEEEVSPPESDTNQKPRSTVASLLAGLALLVAIAAAGGVAWLWQLTQQEATTTQSRIASLGDATRQDITALSGRLDTLAAHQLEVDNARATLANSLQSLREEIGRDRSAWAVAETAYYLELANARLQLLRDAPTALQALRLADARLQKLGDPAFVPVRELLAKEIAALEALPAVDLTGAALALGGLATQIPNLPLHAPVSTARSAADTAAVADSGTAAADDTTPRWREEAAKIWAVMRELVQVRRTDKRIEPLLSADEQRLLIANLQLQLQTARYAVLARDTQLLHDSVGTARDWLLQFYDQDSAATRAVVERLDELGKLELAPALPDISAGLRQLRNISNGKPPA